MHRTPLFKFCLRLTVSEQTVFSYISRINEITTKYSNQLTQYHSQNPTLLEVDIDH
jgi:hypothetical protein